MKHVGSNPAPSNNENTAKKEEDWMNNFVKACLFIVIILFLVGCTATNINADRSEAMRRISELREIAKAYRTATINNLENEDLLCICALYRNVNLTFSEKEKIANELINNRNEAITPQEWDLVDAHMIKIGMSRCALYASRGKPSKINKSVGVWGVHIQHIYSLLRTTPVYVYTQNGKVTSWQN